MNFKPLGPVQNLENPNRSSGSHDVWVALGTILAVVLMILIILTLVGAGGADAALLDHGG